MIKQTKGYFFLISPKISIIIPVYNVETYLEECLDSILSQDLSDIEIICVNDGSTDGSLAILQRYAMQNLNIILIDKENDGAASARNFGLQKAQGEYIFFVDSDDYLLTTDTLSRLYTTASKQNLDILSFNHASFGDKTKESHAKCEIGIIRDGKYYLRHGYSIVMPWGRISKRDYLKSICFAYNETILYEDDEGFPRLYVNAKRVSHLDAVLYAYRQRSGSLMTQKLSLLAFSSLKTIIYTYDTLLQKESDKSFQIYLRLRIINYLERYYNFLLMHTIEFPEAVSMYAAIKNSLSLPRLWLFMMNNEEQFIYLTHIKKDSKLSHPLIYFIRKFKKTFFKILMRHHG
jgi:glycosyltransferase involved in cell wall biosynthesis